VTIAREKGVSFVHPHCLTHEALAKLALRAKFDDFDVGSIFRKLTYPIGHRRFAKNSDPTLKAQIWPQTEFCKSLT
jgi:hypothetical protein